jgi:tetratricopeptide (TPR) repeat protein
MTDSKTASRLTPGPAPRGVYAAMAAVFLLSLALYAATAAPEFLFDDNPEFIASAHVLGITHPPGYPLFSLLGKLFSLLAPAAVPFAVNLCSAFFAAAACALICRILWRMTGLAALSAAAALLFAASQTFWSQAVQAEVYTTNIFFTALLLHCLIELDLTRDMRAIPALALAGALAIVNHYTAVLILPVIAAYILVAHRQHIRGVGRALAPAAFALVLGLSVLAYLPLRSAAHPPVAWDATRPPEKWLENQRVKKWFAAHPKQAWASQDTAAGFFIHLQGVETLGDVQRVGLGQKLKFLKHYGVRALHQAPWVWVLFLAPGAWALLRRRGLGALFACLFLTTSAGFLLTLNYLYGPRTTYVVSFFYITSFLFLFLAAGLGLADTVGRARAGKFASAAILLALAGASVYSNAHASSMLHNHIAADYGRNMLRTMGRDGAVFSPVVTESFPLACLRIVNGQRHDTIVYGKHGDAEREIGRRGDPFGVMAQAQATEQNPGDAFIKTLTASRPTYLTMGAMTQRPGIYPVLDGILYHLIAADRPPQDPPPGPWNKYQMRGVSLQHSGYDYLTRYVVSKYFLLQGAQKIQENQPGRAEQIFSDLRRFNPDSQFLHLALAAIYFRIGNLEKALASTEDARDAPPEEGKPSLINVSIYNNLGDYYLAMGRFKDAVASFEKMHQLDPTRALAWFQLGRAHQANAEWFIKNHAPQQAAAACLRSLEAFKKYTASDKDNASVHNQMGLCAEMSGQFFRAETYYTLAMDAGDQTGVPEAYRNAAILYEEKLDRPSDARNMYEKYLERIPPGPEASIIHVKLAQLYNDADMSGRALDHLAQIEEYADNMPSDFRTGAFLQAAIALENQNRIMEALHAYREGAKIGAAYPDIHRRYGMFLARNFDLPREAVHQLTLYLEQVPESPFRYEVQGQIQALRDKIGNDPE